MTRILIAVRDTGSATEGAIRAKALATTLRNAHRRADVQTLQLGPDVVFALAEHSPDVVVAVGYGPCELVALRALRCPIVWDMGALTAEQASDPQMGAALATAMGFVDVDRDVALLIEDKNTVGLSQHDVAAAVAQALSPTVVIIGEGLGNMIYATPLIRWLSEQRNGPIDVVIHNRFDVAVSLFAGAPWINAVYPGFEYLVGHHYALCVSSVTTGGFRPPFTSDQTLRLDDAFSYNLEGRFIHETRLNFLGLDEVFGPEPNLLEELPAPFIRDFTYMRPEARIIGVAGGMKSGAWTKREWGMMVPLVEALRSKGWEVRSFGLPGEHLEGAEDYTGLPMRTALERMAECRAFISYDGGIMHMAEAIGVPSVWLFGPTSLVKNGPFFDHSRVVLTEIECGPCLFKADWQACQCPLCMEGITMQMVLDALDDIEAQIEHQGYRLKQAPEHTDALAYEVNALAHPGSADTVAQSARARSLFAARDADIAMGEVLHLWSVGDLWGATTLFEALARRHKHTPLMDLLAALLRQAAPEAATARLPKGRLDDAALGALSTMIGQSQIPQGQKDALILATARALLVEQPKTGLAALLDAISQTAPYCLQNGPLLQRLASLAGRDDANAPSAYLDPAFQRMQRLKNTDLTQALTPAAETMASYLDLSPEALFSTAFTPDLAKVTKTLETREEVIAAIGSHEVSLCHHDLVLVLVPHVKAKDGRVGTSTRLIQKHMQGLVSLGLRPVVVSVGYEDVPTLWSVRDSVTYLQGHRGWPEATWQTLLAMFPPKSVLAYGNVAQELALPKDISKGILSVSLDGLADPLGLLVDAPLEQVWDLTSKDAVPPDHNLDALNSILFTAPDRLAPVVGPVRVLVLLNAVEDYWRFVTVATALPDVRFDLVTNITHRGVEKNIRLWPTKSLPKGASPQTHILMQFAARPTPLTAETLTWLESGGRAIVPAHHDPIYGDGLSSAQAPDTHQGWIAALRSLLQTLSENAATILSD